MIDNEYELKIRQGYRTTTLQIIYYMPDYRSILNEFIWQFLDRNPTFPRTHKFLWHWKENVDATIKEINIAQEGDIYPRPFRYVDYCMSLEKIQ